MTYQNYKHYKLPITMNPLDYGKLILKIDELNLFILQLPKTNNILILTQKGLTNHIKLYKEGDFRFEYSDYKLSHNSFSRIIDSTKFTFRDNKLVQSIVRTLILILFIIFIILNFESNTINIAMVGLNSLILKREFASVDESKKDYFKQNWNSIYFNINNQIFSIELLEGYFNKFWKIVSPKLFDDSHIYVLLKFQFEDGNIHTIGKLIRIDHDNFKNFITQIINYMEGMGDYYNQSPFKRIIFSYGYSRGKISDTLTKTKSEVNLINFKDMKLPISVDPNDYGSIIKIITLEDHKIYIISDKLNRTIIFEEFENENIITFSKDQIEIIKFIDNKFSEGKFLRKLGKKSLFFENGNKTLELLSLNTPFITKLKTDKIENNNFITLDIETYGSEVLSPYLISFYDGVHSNSFYLSDYDSIDSMMEACFKKLFIRKYNNFSVYIHNLTKFDIYFLLKYLINYCQIDPLIHNGRIIQLNINYGLNLQYKLSLKDSYLILLSSLEKLGKNFGTQTQKTIFPHKFIRENNLDYIGEIPGIDNFFKILENDYNNYSSKFNNNWNLKSEAIKYCETDCISLYQILLKFNSLIFENFKKNIHRYPTLPSLAFAIFRSSFMDEENIPKLTGNIEFDIRQGYTGGSTDMFIPYGKNIKCYDVNSLYPSVMINKDMPIGKSEKFIGDISKFESNTFGFFYVKVNCLENIMHPILQIKYKTKGGIKTISPIGSWSMWIFSEEMYNAQKYGYTFEILEGYKFERGVIFKKYVEVLYNLRQQYDKTNPLNLISKILLNSLYGRFGMKEIIIKYEICLQKDFYKITNKENIFDTIELGDHILLGLNIEADEDNSNISVGVAAAITAYARIHMSKFKNNPSIRLFYTDTDSIYTDSELDQIFIDDKVLGKLKLEHICEEAVFLGPKSYCLKTKKGLITKVKGLKNTADLSIQDFKDLLQKDFYKEQTHKKWFRNLEQGNITIKEQIYRVQKTDNKREYIYSNNILTSTKAIKISN